jgi:hypothetical protein
MTDLHWALLAIAGVLLLVLWVYSQWQERRTLARFDAALRQGVGDPLETHPAPSAKSGVRRIEPRLDALLPASEITGRPPSLTDASAQADRDAAAAGSQERDQPNDELPEAPAYSLPDGWVEDPLLDFVIELRCAHAIDGVSALEARSQLDRLELPLPTHLAVWDAKSQSWTAPDRFGFYSELLVAVQIAHRSGALSEIDATRFVAAAQQIALAVEADFDAPDVPRLVAQAAALDRMCEGFDVQIALTVTAIDAAWTADVVQSAAAALGFRAVAAGQWELREDGRDLVLLLGTPSLPTRQLAVTIDVPLVRPDYSPLVRQFTVAEQLALRLNGRVVDDNDRPVQREPHFAVAAQLAGLYDEMQSSGIPAGSERARRLYAD